MYRIRTPNFRKRDQVMRGPCRIASSSPAARATFWLRPSCSSMAFSTKRSSGLSRILGSPAITFSSKARPGRSITMATPDRRRSCRTPTARRDATGRGGNASLIESTPDVLISGVRSRAHGGLWLREPSQFLHDALPRARAYLIRFPAPPDTRSLGLKPLHRSIHQ